MERFKFSVLNQSGVSDVWHIYLNYPTNLLPNYELMSMTIDQYDTYSHYPTTLLLNCTLNLTSHHSQTVRTFCSDPRAYQWNFLLTMCWIDQITSQLLKWKLVSCLHFQNTKYNICVILISRVLFKNMTWLAQKQAWYAK